MPGLGEEAKSVRESVPNWEKASKTKASKMLNMFSTAGLEVVAKQACAE